tara:strand:+ start:386 stop:586 length:201 start_codon:yes stop_codon:yes gene_type:complete
LREQVVVQEVHTEVQIKQQVPEVLQLLAQVTVVGVQKVEQTEQQTQVEVQAVAEYWLTVLLRVVQV